MCFHCGPHFVKTFAVDFSREAQQASAVTCAGDCTDLGIRMCLPCMIGG